jgi:hypothetical protein
MAIGAGTDGPAGSGLQLTTRAGEDSSEVAMGFHVYAVAKSDNGIGAFGRINLNLLEWDRVGTDDNIGSLGPAFQLGVGFGVFCIVATASRDVRLFHPDDTFVGVSFGLCGIDRR